MPTVTKIKKQKNTNRISVYLDKSYAFGIDLENFIKLNLRVGDKISNKDKAKIINLNKITKVSDKLIRFATVRPRSEKEINNWFTRKKVSENMQKKLIDRLFHLELIDDNKFARWWFEQRTTFKLKSKKEIKYELKTKGIRNDIINEIFKDYEINEIDTVRKIIKKKAFIWRKFDKIKRKQKITEYLLRKGFGWSVISNVIGEND